MGSRSVLAIRTVAIRQVVASDGSRLQGQRNVEEGVARRSLPWQPALAGFLYVALIACSMTPMAGEFARGHCLFNVRQLPRSVEQRFLRAVEAQEDFDAPLALAGPSSTPCPPGALKFHGDTGVAPDGWRHNQSGPLPD
jgi:hypothetical protein